jgi:uncharacterized lipoprotein YddW (UPF0748 family)
MKVSLRFVVAIAAMGLTAAAWGAAPAAGEKASNRNSAGPQKVETAVEPGQVDTGAAETAAPAGAGKSEITWTHPEVEFRGIWMPHNDLFLSTDTVERKLDALAKANFNAILPVAYTGGYAVYPDSKYLPQHPKVRGRDPLGVAVEQAHKRGLEVHVWMEYGFYAYHSPDATKEASKGPWLDANPELLAVNAQGGTYLHNPAWGDFYSMCPANPKCHELLANIAAEIVERYPVEGINLDRIRFPGATYCYCNYCKEHFKKDTGLDLVPFEKGSDGEKKFLEWKRQQLVKAVKTIRDRVKAVRPDVVLTSYVVPPDEMNDKAQSWDLWAKQRLLDGVAVSMYGKDIAPAAQKSAQILGDRKDLLLAAISAEVPTYVDNVQKARSYAPLGQITWYAGQVEDDLERLATGPYAKPARSPFARRAHSPAPVSAK